MYTADVRQDVYHIHMHSYSYLVYETMNIYVNHIVYICTAVPCSSTGYQGGGILLYTYHIIDLNEDR